MIKYVNGTNKKLEMKLTLEVELIYIYILILRRMSCIKYQFQILLLCRMQMERMDGLDTLQQNLWLWGHTSS